MIDAARYLTVYAGTGVRRESQHPPVLYDRNTNKEWDAQPYSDAVEILVPAAGATLYVFAGPTYGLVRASNADSGLQLPVPLANWMPRPTPMP